MPESVKPIETDEHSNGPMISLRDVRVSYGGREILHGITFDVQRGETLVILGGSGSGKSTLLRTMVGLERPTSGSVWVYGTNLATAMESEMDEVRKRIGLSFQGGALIGSMTVGDNIALPLREHTNLEDSTIQVMVRIKLQQVGLLKFENFMPSQLSGGMKKRAALARKLSFVGTMRVERRATITPTADDLASLMRGSGFMPSIRSTMACGVVGRRSGQGRSDWPF